MKAVAWAAGGAAFGLATAAVAFAPASWAADAIARASGERVLLAEPRGSVWRGSGVLVLTGGPGSRDASALPGRLDWRVGLDGTALALRATHACCLNGEMLLRVRPGIGRVRLELVSPSQASAPTTAAVVGQWPAAWLAGLGTPWNTLMPSGQIQLTSPGLVFEQVQGRWRIGGSAVLEVANLGSRLSTLDVLGSYRVQVQGAPLDAPAGASGTSPAGASPGAAVEAPVQVLLSTISGALQLSGSGTFAGGGGGPQSGGSGSARLRFNGQAQAAPGSEAVLANLLNIIGRRQGATSLISIG